MNHTIQLTAEQFQALQSGQPITIKPPKPTITKWEPIKGAYAVCLEHSGFTYQTTSQAEHASKAIRSYARQLAWLAENDDRWIADWSNGDQNKYRIYFDHDYNIVKVTFNFTDQTLGVVYMSKENAEKLAKLMNDGIVEF